jgi:hypothetical protein
VAGGLQQGDKPDQRQSDECIGIVAFQTLEEGNPEALRPETAGAVIGALAFEIAFDARAAERAEVHPERLDQDLGLPAARIEHTESGQEQHAATRGMLQLGDGRGVIAGFAEDGVIETGDLIRADMSASR